MQWFILVQLFLKNKSFFLPKIIVKFRCTLYSNKIQHIGSHSSPLDSWQLLCSWNPRNAWLATTDLGLCLRYRQCLEVTGVTIFGNSIGILSPAYTLVVTGYLLLILLSKIWSFLNLVKHISKILNVSNPYLFFQWSIGNLIFHKMKVAKHIWEAFCHVVSISPTFYEQLLCQIPFV